MPTTESLLHIPRPLPAYCQSYLVDIHIDLTIILTLVTKGSCQKDCTDTLSELHVLAAEMSLAQAVLMPRFIVENYYLSDPPKPTEISGKIHKYWWAYDIAANSFPKAFVGSEK